MMAQLSPYSDLDSYTWRSPAAFNCEANFEKFSGFAGWQAPTRNQNPSRLQVRSIFQQNRFWFEQEDFPYTPIPRTWV